MPAELSVRAGGGFGAGLLAAVLSAAAGGADDLTPVRRHAPPRHEPVTLTRDGQPTAVIVSPLQPGPLLRSAIQDLQAHVELITGVKLPIVSAASPGLAAVTVAIRPDDEPDLFPAPTGREGFAVRTAPNLVLLAGRDEAGAAWAVYDFLERSLGVRWYWPEERNASELLGTSLPSRRTLTVEPAHWSDQPVFRKREIWPSGGRSIGSADVAALHRRLRSHDSWGVELIVHAPHGWDKVYRNTRPEIFQLRSDGERDFSMLCYGNPATLRTYLEQIEIQRTGTGPVDRSLAILRGNAVTVSPADMAVACTCPDCRPLWNPEGGRYGTASRVVGSFVAALAREVKARWPELTVIYLPYKNYTLAPEGVEFPDNVEVQLCGMPGLALSKEPDIRLSEQANIDDWVRLSGRRIQNWHYSCWPEDRTRAAYLFPGVIAAHYRDNRDKTVGSFINGTGNHWPRQHVSLFVWMKTLWNPDVDPAAVIEGFVRRMYGPAAPQMRELIGLQIAGWEESRWPRAVFSPKTVYEISYPRTTVHRMETLLEEAFAAAREDRLTSRRLEYVAGPLREFFTQAEEHATGSGLRTLQLLQVAEEPVLDGRLDEPAWQDVEPLPFVMATDRDRPEPRFPTTVQAVWTRRGVTFGFRMTEPEPDKLKRDIGAETRDAALTWWDDNVELFLDVTGERTDSYQLIVNANGSIADFYNKDPSWDGQGIRTASFVGQDFWSMEVFVPYSAFPGVAGPGSGATWYGNFTRHRVTDGENREYQRFNTRFAKPSNDQNAFGPLPFVER